MTYIAIDDASFESGTCIWPTNTDGEVQAARTAVRDAGLEYAEEYAGEPDGHGDSYKNGNKLFAAK